MGPVFDSHFHLIDYRFPLIVNQGYLPDSFTVADYLARTANYNITGGAVVSGSFHGVDQSYLRSALCQLGEGFVGVAQLPLGVTDQEILSLHQAGVRAIRFNILRDCVTSLKDIEHLSRQVFEVCGWHSEFYLAAESLIELEAMLGSLPQICVDHLGLQGVGHEVLYRLVDGGAKVKATGFSRLDFMPVPFMNRLYQINPEALLFGSDLPSTRAPAAFTRDDIELVYASFDDEALQKIMWQNAASFYRLRNSL